MVIMMIIVKTIIFIVVAMMIMTIVIIRTSMMITIDPFVSHSFMIHKSSVGILMFMFSLIDTQFQYYCLCFIVFVLIA